MADNTDFRPEDGAGSAAPEPSRQKKPTTLWAVPPAEDFRRLRLYGALWLLAAMAIGAASGAWRSARATGLPASRQTAVPGTSRKDCPIWWGRKRPQAGSGAMFGTAAADGGSNTAPSVFGLISAVCVAFIALVRLLPTAGKLGAKLAAWEAAGRGVRSALAALALSLPPAGIPYIIVLAL